LIISLPNRVATREKKYPWVLTSAMRLKQAARVRIRYISLFSRGLIPFSRIWYGLLPNFLRPRNITTEFFGKPFVVPYGELNIFLAIEAAVVFSNTYRIENIKDGDVIVDAGANMGVFAIFCAVKFPHSMIYAYEPTPSTFEVLKENAKFYPNISCTMAALGDRDGEASLVVVPGNGAMSSVGEGGIPIKIWKIDSLFLPRVDFLKIHAEGYEAEILQGARKTVQDHLPVISMAAYHRPKDKEELPALLNSIAPYDCELYYDKEEGFPHLLSRRAALVAQRY